MWPSRLLLLCMRPARETRARRGWATVSGLLVLYFLCTVRLFRKKDMWVKIFRPARARFAQLAPVKFLGRVRYVTHRETLSAPSPRRRHASRRASSWQGGCRARRARASGAREPRCDGGRAGAFHPAINFPTPGTGCAPLAMCFRPARVSAARLGAHPASIARNSRPIVAASVPVANPSERGAARVPRTRTLPAGRPPSLGQRSLVRAFAATTGSHRDQGAGAPAHRAARFLPRGSLALCAQDSSRSRLEDAVLARGIPSRPLNGLATRASPRSAQLFSPVPRLPELATDRHSDRPSLSIRRFVVSPLFPATIPPRAISNTPRVSSSRSSRLSRRGRISSTTTTFSSRCVPRGSARPSPDSPQPAPTYPA